MTRISYRNLHFPSSIAQKAVWMYVHFNLNLRDVEELLAERGIKVSYETIRRWVARFGPLMAKRMRQTRSAPHP
ncbi:MAG: transposase-like protein [Parvibaculaceae bacterium]|jgi:transposase-like protein